MFKLKYSVGTRTKGCKLVMNKFRLEIRRIYLALRAVNFWNSFPVEISGTEHSTFFKMTVNSLCDIVARNRKGCDWQASKSLIF